MKNYKNKDLIVYSILIILILIIYIIDKIYDIEIIFCPFYKLTGLCCPGCGITRMIESIIMGKFYQAFRYNPLMFILSPFLLIYLICRIIEIIKKKNIFTDKINNKIWICLLVIVILFGIIRNIPGFEFLLPTKV